MGNGDGAGRAHTQEERDDGDERGCETLAHSPNSSFCAARAHARATCSYTLTAAPTNGSRPLPLGPGRRRVRAVRGPRRRRRRESKARGRRRARAFLILLSGHPVLARPPRPAPRPHHFSHRRGHGWLGRGRGWAEREQGTGERESSSRRGQRGDEVTTTSAQIWGVCSSSLTHPFSSHPLTSSSRRLSP